MADNFDHKYDLFLIGDSGVGKSCLMTRFVHNAYTNLTETTLGVDLLHKKIKFENEKIKLTIWDMQFQGYGDAINQVINLLWPKVTFLEAFNLYRVTLSVEIAKINCR